MTRLQSEIRGQWRKSVGRQQTAFAFEPVVRPRETIAWRVFFALSMGFLLAVFVSPLFYVSEAAAQSYRADARRVNDGRMLKVQSRQRKRAVAGRRYRVLPKPRTPFLSGLFGKKRVKRKVRRRKTAAPFQGLKSFFGSFKKTGRTRSDAASLRSTYEQRMREAGREQSGSGLTEDGNGWGADPTRASTTNFSSNWGRGQYRTMCVRMCDGYYFPIRFKSSSRQFESDTQRCNSKCYNAPTKLFYYSNPGGSIENMRALDGALYKDIANAFKYRKTYVAECRCKVEPWSKRAKEEHKNFELEREIRKEAAQKDVAEQAISLSFGSMKVSKARQLETSLPYQ